MKLTINVWPQDRLDKEMGGYRVLIDNEEGVTILDGILSRDELKKIKDGDPIEVEFNYPQGGVRL